ncbi:S-adenosyl-L-methionine-dependent methyltransferase [Stachybotrys elegans]|uniref:S-adenosyl-L-methionine-dependent methyltransferase n=1 Tax=Stachybotrys elegans TaxID=80388 RepID=A0A8K0SFT2_9HYPO|nr:S-adenosyl-L-methionine-dependent methyltransferase [Stachybotrys elegans]
MTMRAGPDGYVMTKPDDATEKSRLDLQHYIWLLTLGGNLHLTPLPENLHKILDIGTGTGVWAAEMARAWPNTQIIATDLVLPQSMSTLPNLTFQKHDADSPWPFEEGCFDFIHGRMLASGIHDWPGLLEKTYRFLVPGGLLELLDVSHPFRAKLQSADNAETSPFIRFGHLAQRSWENNGLDYYATAKHSERMKQLGFVGITKRTFQWPLGDWPESQQDKKIGKLTLENFSSFIATAGVAILTRDGFMDEDEAKAAVSAAEQDLQHNHNQKGFYLTMVMHTASRARM